MQQKPVVLQGSVQRSNYAIEIPLIKRDWPAEREGHIWTDCMNVFKYRFHYHKMKVLNFVPLYLRKTRCTWPATAATTKISCPTTSTLCPTSTGRCQTSPRAWTSQRILSQSGSKVARWLNFAAQRSGAIVQKPEGPNSYNLKIWLQPPGNHAEKGLVDCKARGRDGGRCLVTWRLDFLDHVSFFGGDSIHRFGRLPPGKMILFPLLEEIFDDEAQRRL